MSDSPMRCAMTGIEIRDSGDGIWDDGEWISWEWIDRQIALQEGGARSGDEEIEPVFDDEDREPSYELLFRILDAKNHDENTSKELSPDWGPIGEAYVAERFEEMILCRSHAEGHDARWGDDFVEIKTISPHKKRPMVMVKRSGNFNMLAVVRVTVDYRLELRFVRRDQLPAGNGGKHLVVSWQTMCRLGKEYPPRPRGAKSRH